MNSHKETCLNKIRFTELVYIRINKKLNKNFTKTEIEKMIFEILKKTDESHFQKKGKNIYVMNEEKNIRITINSFTYSVITVDYLNPKQPIAISL